MTPRLAVALVVTVAVVVAVPLLVWGTVRWVDGALNTLGADR